MEIPHLVGQRLGDEPVEAAVNLGDDDLVCVTPTRTVVYRSEGLLSDESVSEYPHELERLDVSDGRRKTEFVFEYVDRTESLTVPGDRRGPVLGALLGGVLTVAEVIDPDESVRGVFTFSELTLVVTSARLVKHVGQVAWDDDFEVYPYADVTGLTFEEGSVATQVVLSVNGRPERIKAPSEDSREVERTLTGALFAYHDVESLAELNEKVEDDDSGPESADEGKGDVAGGLSLDDGISPLVGGDDEKADHAGGSGDRTETGGRTTSTSASGSGVDAGDGGGSAGGDGGGSAGGDGSREPGTASTAGGGTEAEPEREPPGQSGVGRASRRSDDGDDGRGAVDPADIEAIEDQLSTLTTAVKQQNKLLCDQQETIERLIEELRQGR